MKQRIILIGGGETVYFLARQLKQRDHHITIINRNKAHCQKLFDQTASIVVHGEGSERKILEEAGARQADVVLAMTPHDHDNLITCQIAMKIFGVPRTIALVNDPNNEDVFTKLGVTTAFSSTRIIAKMIERHAHFDDIKRLMHVGNGKVQVTDVELHRDAPAVGKTLAELGISENTLVASIVRDEEVIIPRGNNQLQVGDHLLIISKQGEDEADLRIIIGEIGELSELDETETKT
ncbi:MAG: NAD-binding protein [Chloroflexota bacterium]